MGSDTGVQLSNLMEKLETAMLNNPAHWKSYYQGSEAEIALARKYSFLTGAAIIGLYPK